jgi:drug/metabolite transporter (DMT)-like permease
MQNWFILALVAPLLWSIVNHLDKYILSRYLKDKGVGALLIFSALSSIIVLPFIVYFFYSSLFNISVHDFYILIFIGFLSAGALYFYLEGMREEEASIVVPLFQLVPVFGYFLGNLILGESLNANQILASLIIMSGIIALTIEIDEDNKVTLKTRVLVLITISSFLFALHDTLFKKVALVESFWVSVFWQYLSLCIAGIFMLVAFKKFRSEFVTMFSHAGVKIFSLNIISEILYMIGNLTNNFATLLAPVALVLVVSSYQPLFVFVIGILLTLFLPKISMEKISRRHFLHKLISILTIIAGSYLLYSVSHY